MHNDVSDYDIWKKFLCIFGHHKRSFEDIIVIHDILQDLFKQICRAFYQWESKPSNMPVYSLYNFIQIRYVNTPLKHNYNEKST